MENTNTNYRKQVKLSSEIETLQKEEKKLVEQRKATPNKVTIGQMPESIRYNKLLTESKLLINLIKIICYRAETDFVNLVSSGYKRNTDEKRALFKSISQSKADLFPDYHNNTLTVTLYSLASPRDNQAIIKTLELLNNTETIFPGTNLKLIYKFASI